MTITGYYLTEKYDKPFKGLVQTSVRLYPVDHSYWMQSTSCLYAFYNTQYPADLKSVCNTIADRNEFIIKPKKVYLCMYNSASKLDLVQELQLFKIKP